MRAQERQNGDLQSEIASLKAEIGQLNKDLKEAASESKKKTKAIDNPPTRSSVP